MDQETQKYFETYFDLFSHECWQVFVAEIANNKEVINSVESTTDANDLYFRKGQLKVLNAIINFAETVELAYKTNDETIDDVEG